MSQPILRASALIGILILQVSLGRGDENAPLKQVQTIPLPDVQGRIDHMAVDLEHERLFVAALGNNSVEVIDLSDGSFAWSAKGLHAPQGIAYLPDLNRIVVANDQGGEVVAFDAASKQLLFSTKLGDDADNVRYDPLNQRVYVGYGDGGLAVLSAGDGRILDRIQFDGHPESFRPERIGQRIFVNVPKGRQVVVIDRVTKDVAARWPLAEAGGNFPMALDEAYHRLLIGCREPAVLLVLDTDTGNQIAKVKIAGDTDDLFFDDVLNRVYVSCGEGFISVVQRRGADRYEDAARIPTAAGARTSLWVPKFNRLYLAVPKQGKSPAEIRVFEVQ